MSAYSPRNTVSVGLGNHRCCMFDTEEDYRASVNSYVQQGLEHDEKIIYAFDTSDPEKILKCFRNDGLEVERALATGQLTLVAFGHTFAPDGSLNPDAIIAALREETERALAEGYQGLRFTVEMTWALGGLHRSERMVEYESKLNSFLTGSRCSALCQYDRRQFDAVALLNVLVTHPIAVVGTETCDNFYYLPMADFHGHELPAGALHFWLENLAARRSAAEDLNMALQESRYRRAEASALLACARGLLGNQEFKDAARSILDSCKGLVGAASAHVSLLSEDGTGAESLLLESGDLSGLIGSSVSVPIRVLREEALQTGEAVYCNDLPHGESLSLADEGSLAPENVLLAPLMINGKALGLLGLCNRPGGFTDGHAQMAVAFSELAAVALHNSRTLESLENSEERFRSVVQTASDAMICIDARQNIVFWNRAAENIFGYSPEEMVGKPVGLILPEQSRHQVQEAIDRLMPVGSADVFRKPLDLVGLRKDGSEFPAELSFASWKTPEGVFYTAIVRDTTERKRQEEQLAYLATHDALTGLPNRRSLEEALSRAVARASRGMVSTLMLLDVDNFKLINDTLGHAAGDQCLIAITRLCQDKLRGSDLIVRLGGDEFAVLLDGTNVEDGRVVAERMRQAIEEFCFNLDGLSFNLSISLGLVAIDGKKSPVTVLSQVDGAMYKAKEQGRNRVNVFQSEEDSLGWLSEANRLARRLKDALKEELFLLYYQPVARLSNRKIEYYEALVRLCGDRGDIITAAEFIPAAERFGLMPQLTRWVVQRVLRTLKQRPDIRVSMNLSFLDLSDETLPDFIEARLREFGIEPMRLGFEIAEAAVAKDLLLAERRLRHLKTLGCHFAMDNFGTSYLSFARLQTLPVDYLKIDGSFIRALENDPAQRALVKAMQMLARSQGKEIVAECVESDATIRILEDIGITYGQGFGLGKPDPTIPRNGSCKRTNLDDTCISAPILLTRNVVVTS